MALGYLRFTFDIDGRVELDRELHGYLGRVSTLKPVFGLIVDDFKEMEAERFANEGGFEGEPKWASLTEAYGEWKKIHYPGKGILEATGELKAAVLSPATTLSDLQLAISIDNDYAIYHQSDKPRNSNLKRRPIIALSAKRKSKWMRFVRDYIWAGAHRG